MLPGRSIQTHECARSFYQYRQFPRIHNFILTLVAPIVVTTISKKDDCGLSEPQSLIYMWAEIIFDVGDINKLITLVANYATEQMRIQLMCDAARKRNLPCVYLLFCTVWAGNPTLLSHYWSWLVMIGTDILLSHTFSITK